MIQEMPGGFCFVCDRPYTTLGHEHHEKEHPDALQAQKQLRDGKGPDSIRYKIWSASRAIQEITKRPVEIYFDCLRK